MDRASMLADTLERHLLTHPACVADPEWYALADRAAAALRELYQQVGAEHLAAVEGASTSEQDKAGREALEAARSADQAGNSAPEAVQPEESAVESNDLELVAIWLHGAAHSAGHIEVVRKIMRLAAQEASEMYSAPDDHATMEEEDDEYGVRSALARFIAQWDECERTARQEDEQG
jgi:hypothetical protein